MSIPRDMSGAAQNAAKSSALNLGVVVAVALRVSVMVPPGVGLAFAESFLGAMPRHNYLEGHRHR
jgi:hypothetical protein